MPKLIGTEDVGKFFICLINGLSSPDEVWQLVSYCEYPTATWKNVRTGEKSGGAINSPNAAEFVRLIPESSGE